MSISNQDKLLNTINNFNKLPHSILLIGEVGSGHVDVCKYIANKFNLLYYDITDFISNEYIDEINAALTPALYSVSLSKIGEREQNILLKLYEEPSEYCYIVLNCDSDDQAIETIKSRSYELTFDRYKRDFLQSLITNSKDTDFILKICTTPGQIEIANHTNMEALKTLCEAMVNDMGRSNFQNMLSISDKINFKDNYDRFDLILFFKALKYFILESGTNKEYKLVNEYSKYIWSMNNKQLYFENMLINLWQLSRSI